MNEFNDYNSIKELLEDAIKYFGIEPGAGACAILEDASIFTELSEAKEAAKNLTGEQRQSIESLEKELFETVVNKHLSFHLRDPDVIDEDRYFREKYEYPESHWWWYMDKIHTGEITKNHLFRC